VNRTIASAAFCFALAAATVPPGHASEVVEIQLRGRYFAEPATVQITVAVEPDAQNRMLRIEADGERFFRASELALSGEEDKRLHNLVFKNLPAGAYTLRAEVFSSDSLRGQATEQLVVTGNGGR
jgi:hypothetical protein